MPFGIAFTEIPLIQRWPQSRSDKRRLAAAARSHHGQEVVLLQNVQHADDVFFPTVEQRRLVELERPQTRIRAGE